MCINAFYMLINMPEPVESISLWEKKVIRHFKTKLPLEKTYTNITDTGTDLSHWTKHMR